MSIETIAAVISTFLNAVILDMTTGSLSIFSVDGSWQDLRLLATVSIDKFLSTLAGL